MKLTDKLSQYWQAIQGNLFHWLQEELGALSEKQKQLVTVLEMIRVDEFIPTYAGYVGRPEDDRCAIANAFKERSTAERANSRLKDEFGALTLRVRGHAKVMTHLMFGVIALTVDQLIRFVT